MGTKRRRFSEEFKREAVRLAFGSGRSVSAVARELDLRVDMLRRWRRRYRRRVEPPSEAELEVRRLRRELGGSRKSETS
jgi:transposase